MPVLVSKAKILYKFYEDCEEDEVMFDCGVLG